MEASPAAVRDTGGVPVPDQPPMSRASVTADRYVQWGGHLLFAVLMGIGLARAVSGATGSPLPVILGATAVACWYVFGAIAIAVRRGHREVAWVLILLAAWSVLTVFSPDFVWVAFVLAMLCWHFLPLALAVPAELVVAVVAVTAALREGPVGAGSVLGPLIGIATAIAVTETVHRVVDAAAARDALASELAQTQLRLARQEREAVVLAERERMGSEIHDGAGQALAGIVMLLQSATDPEVEPQRRQAQATTALEMATTALAQTRSFLRDLDGSAVGADGLAAGLQGAVDQAGRLGLAAELHAHGTPAALSEQSRSVLVRAAQEALANTARHAQATRAMVTLTVVGDEVHLDVVDDGRGFDPAQTGSGTGFGLSGLRSRVARCGGAVTIDSEPGDGTTVHVCLPIEAAGGAR